jgi:DNA-binding MarR family transcriptional regulator
MVEPVAGSWTFLTNHAHVLLCIHQDDEIRLRDIAGRVGVTERAAQKIVSDLADAGYLTIQRVGRRNRYTIEQARPLRHTMERDHLIGELLSMLTREVSTA